jgi:hypothetical protein
MSWIANVIGRTAAREGSYASLNPNSDGAGLSFGILQGTQASGNVKRHMNGTTRAPRSRDHPQS